MKFITDLIKEGKKNTSEVTKIINKKAKYLAEKGKPIKNKQDQIIKGLTDSANKGGAITQEKVKEVIKRVVKKGKEVGKKQQKAAKDIKEKITKIDEEKIQESV